MFNTDTWNSLYSLSYKTFNMHFYLCNYTISTWKKIFTFKFSIMFFGLDFVRLVITSNTKSTTENFQEQLYQDLSLRLCISLRFFFIVFICVLFKLFCKTKKKSQARNFLFFCILFSWQHSVSCLFLSFFCVVS